MKSSALENFTLYGSMVVRSASEGAYAGVIKCTDVVKQMRIWQCLHSCNKKNFIN